LGAAPIRVVHETAEHQGEPWVIDGCPLQDVLDVDAVEIAVQRTGLSAQESHAVRGCSEYGPIQTLDAQLQGHIVDRHLGVTTGATARQKCNEAEKSEEGWALKQGVYLWSVE
jgi:hypothetical protein